MSSNARTVRVFVGTYTQTTSKGIYVYDVDTASGVMEYVSHVGGITNPSFLCPDARTPASSTPSARRAIPTAASSPMPWTGPARSRP